jgi:hypothetical protein
MSSNILTLSLWTNDNLLSDDAWAPIEPKVETSMADGVLTCQAAPVDVCDPDEDPKAMAGFTQRVTLNQTTRQAVWARVETRPNAEFNTRRVQDYGLRVNFLDASDEPISSAFIPIAWPGDDWMSIELHAIPAAPAASAEVRLCSLAMTGAAEFRNAALMQIEGDAISLDTIPLAGGTTLAEGWYVLDVANPDALVPVDNVGTIGLEATCTNEPRGTDLHTELALTDTTGTDRVLSAMYVCPLEAKNWVWLESMRKTAAVASPGEYQATAGVQAGRGQMSNWPLATVADGADGRAISLDFTQPAVYRVGYSAGLNALYIVFDIALTPEKATATLATDVYAFDGTWGFRGAFERMFQLQPEAFKDRTGGHGLWVPFFESTAIPDFEDFNFRFKEGIGGDLVWGNETGKLQTFHYIEPLTFWMAIDPEIPRGYDAAMNRLEELKAEGNHEAHCWENSVYHRPTGRPAGIFVDAAWCNGLVWSMNSAPGLPEPNHFSTIWNEEKCKQYVEVDDPLHRVKGWYIDSIEGYITEDLDYNREHFAYMATPTSFDAQTLQPAVFTGLVVYEFTRKLAEELWARDGLTMANTVPGRYCWLAPYLDVLGTETNWHHNGEWVPLSDEGMLYRRALSGDKPYCFLMNSDFSKFTYDMSDRYMKRCVAYGMYPGYFSPNAFSDSYFGNPEWYERDRELFKKYVPLCKRAGEAGWKPITHARVDIDKVYVERFGEDLLTLFNDTDTEQTITVTLDTPLASFTNAVDLVTGNTVDLTDGKLTITLGVEDVAAIELQN